MTAFLVVSVVLLCAGAFWQNSLIRYWRAQAAGEREQALVERNTLINQLHDKQVRIDELARFVDKDEEMILTLREQLKGTVVFTSRRYVTHELLERAVDPEYVLRDNVERLRHEIADRITQKAITRRWTDEITRSEIFEMRVMLSDLAPEVFAEVRQ